MSTLIKKLTKNLDNHIEAELISNFHTGEKYKTLPVWKTKKNPTFFHRGTVVDKDGHFKMVTPSTLMLIEYWITKQLEDDEDKYDAVSIVVHKRYIHHVSNKKWKIDSYVNDTFCLKWNCNI